jgi:hypothetical protein
MNRIKQHIASASPLFWVVLIVVILGLSFGGVSAYLTWSSDGVENQFVTAEHPQATVSSAQGENGTDYTISVTDPGYAVYLRATVIVNWENENVNPKTNDHNILAAMPVLGTDYILTLHKNWTEGSDGFYYYQPKIQDNAPIPFVTVNELVPKDGYNLKVTVLAQTIQAVGTTDADDTVTAVQDAWPR